MNGPPLDLIPCAPSAVVAGGRRAAQDQEPLRQALPGRLSRQGRETLLCVAYDVLRLPCPREAARQTRLSSSGALV